MAKLFLPQATLEEWALDDKADVKDGKLMIPGENATYPVAAAVHFLNVVSGTDDHKLVQKVKSLEHLQQLGAEHLADSVLMGETAYEVVPGYVTEVPVTQQPTGGREKPANPEADLLAAFLLNKL
ncbi:MAG: hypothetical protein M3Y59_22190 [Myxococcota bacterium]|nr:hypothetical protein [Myxococcota bacterium]